MNVKKEKLSEVYESMFNLEMILKEASPKESYIINLIYHLLYDLKKEINED